MKIKSSHNYDAWRTQFARTKRWHTRLQKVRVECGRVGIYQDFEDYIYAFFQNCFHLRDWLSKSGVVAKSELEQLFASHVELRLCGDICNGTKHMTLTKPPYVDADFYTFREYDYLHIPSPADGSHSMEKFTIGAARQNHDAFELADRCMEIWHEFLERHALLTTAAQSVNLT